MVKKVKLDSEDLARIYLPYRNRERYDIVRMIPDRDARNTREKMEKFLVNHFDKSQSGEMVGFEMDYYDDTVYFNFITDSYKSTQTRERLDSVHEEDGRLGTPDDDFIDIREDEYMAAFDFSFLQDYWKPIRSYKELGKRDPLDVLLTEMKGNHDLKFKFQVIAQPISDNRWKRRYPIPWMINSVAKDWMQAIINYSSSIKYIMKFSLNLNESSYLKTGINKLRKGIKNTFSPLTWLTNGLSYEVYKNKFVPKEAESKIDRKINQNGYVTQIRLICVGSEQNVENYADEVKNVIETHYSYNSEGDVISQGLDGRQYNKSWQITQAARMVARESGMNIKRQFSDHEDLYWLKKERKDPTILTPDELAGLMHYIEGSNSVEIEYT